MDKLTCCPESKPQAGEVYVCATCAMTVLVTKSCGCDDCECVCLACCGKAMVCANN